MNYYERHLGDYARDTGHLSMAEHGAYTLLLDRYYATEAPIPADLVYRVAHARSGGERACVDRVLAEFFTLSDGVYINKRAGLDIARYEKSRIASVENGKLGGRPKSQQNQRQDKPNGLQIGSELETQSKAHQTPVTSNQSPAKAKAKAKADARSAEKRGTRLPTDWEPDADLLAWAKSERPDVLLAVELAKFRDYWIAKPGQQGVKLDWPATFRNWIRSAREGPPRAPASKPAIAQNFRDKTYTGTPDDELPSFLRAAQA